MTSRTPSNSEMGPIIEGRVVHNGTNERRIEPTFEPLQPIANENEIETPPPSSETPLSARLREIARQYDVRAITPREMVDLSVDLYVSGIVTRDQYAELSFQPELLPNFEHTIGALTGERAEPDRPRDYTEIWRQRLEFETKHAHGDTRVIARTQKILDLLTSFDREEG